MRSIGWLGLGFFVLSSVTSAACAASGTSQAGDLGPQGGASGADGGSGNVVPEDPETAAPHALGSIVLGETRSSATGDSSPVISASFVPDAKLVKSCTKKVGACELTEVPKCSTGTGTTTSGCAAGEVCSFDDDCEAKCVAACTKTCGPSETCYFHTDPGNGQRPTEADMGCKKKDRFDAGAIAFDGTTQAITLFPPYNITPNGNGAPFMARSEIRVQASGASSAGFEKFDEKFTSTTFLETNPPLRELERSKVFGSGALDIAWVPGEDTVYVLASGPGGSAKCPADDTSGTFELPRNVIEKVTTVEGSTTSSGSLTIAVTRERREVRKEKKTIGEVEGQTVQPDGWVELITRSTESHSFASCGTGLSICNDACVSLQSDAKNCGACGKVCQTGYYCTSGICQ
jgi:hypothetical protein